MAERLVVILGAGASFDANAPGLRTLLETAFATHAQALPELDAFLADHFRSSGPERRFPALPTVLGILDLALDRKQDLDAEWGMDRLRQVRREVEYAILVTLRGLQVTQNYLDLVDWLTIDDDGPTIISLNYDLLADTALIMRSEVHGGIHFPDYGCDIATEVYRREERRFGKLYKLVGSLHWMYCPSCQRLDALFYSDDAMPSEAARAFDAARLGDAYGKDARACPRAGCGAVMRPVIVSPSPVHERPNPHIARSRYLAERALQQADAAVFVGYAMNPSDLELTYLLQRGLAGLPPDRITVVAAASENVRQHYLDVFGPRVAWTGLELGEWTEERGTVAEQ